MANEKWRMDLKGDIRKALEPYFENETFGLSAATYAALSVVLPHFEAAYQRGLMAERSRAGYQKIKEG